MSCKYGEPLCLGIAGTIVCPGCRKEQLASVAVRLTTSEVATRLNCEQAEETVLVLRSCREVKGKLHSWHDKTFEWPRSGLVKAPDWGTRKPNECGGGLHGLLWGAGNAKDCCYWGEDAKWLVVEVLKNDVVDIDGEKVKFPRGNVIFCGTLSEAAKVLFTRAPNGMPITGGSAAAGDRGSAAAGDMGSAAAGYRGSAAAGDRGRVKGKSATAISVLYWDGKRRDYWRKVAVVDEDGFEPDVWYEVRDEKLVKALDQSEPITEGHKNKIEIEKCEAERKAAGKRGADAKS